MLPCYNSLPELLLYSLVHYCHTVSMLPLLCRCFLPFGLHDVEFACMRACSAFHGESQVRFSWSLGPYVANFPSSLATKISLSFEMKHAATVIGLLCNCLRITITFMQMIK